MGSRIKGISVNGVVGSVFRAEKGYSFTIQKTYKDKETDERKYSNTFFVSDIGNMMQVLIRIMLEMQALGWNEGDSKTLKDQVEKSTISFDISSRDTDDMF